MRAVDLTETVFEKRRAGPAMEGGSAAIPSGAARLGLRGIRQFRCETVGGPWWIEACLVRMVSIVCLVALMGIGGGCRRRENVTRRHDGAGGSQIRFPGFVPENAVGLALADGRWLVSTAARLWNQRDGSALVRLVREKFHLDISKVGKVWVVLFPGDHAGPLLFDPVVVVQGAAFLGRWDAVVEGRGAQRLVAGLEAMDCGSSVCLGSRGSLVSVARALRGEGRARAASDLWDGALRFLAAHREGFASVMELSGRFPAGPTRVRMAMSRSGRLRVRLLGSANPETLMAAVKRLLNRAARASERRADVPGARRALDALTATRVHVVGSAVVVEVDGALAILQYAVTGGIGSGQAG